MFSHRLFYFFNWRKIGFKSDLHHVEFIDRLPQANRALKADISACLLIPYARQWQTTYIEWWISPIWWVVLVHMAMILSMKPWLLVIPPGPFMGRIIDCCKIRLVNKPAQNWSPNEFPMYSKPCKQVWVSVWRINHCLEIYSYALVAISLTSGRHKHKTQKKTCSKIAYRARKNEQICNHLKLHNKTTVN